MEKNVSELKQVDWKNKLLPTVVQNEATGSVLMLAYSSRESLEKTLRTKRAWFYSRSRKKLWEKGETSGNRMRVVSVSADCDGDSLLFQVNVSGKGVACHTGKKSCFDCAPLSGRKTLGAGFFAELFEVLLQRKRDRKFEAAKGSFVASIINDKKKIASKLREECGELVKAMQKQGKNEVAWEAADVVFFTLVALANRGVGVDKVVKMLEERKGKRRKK